MTPADRRKNARLRCHMVTSVNRLFHHVTACGKDTDRTYAIRYTFRWEHVTCKRCLAKRSKP